jgi:hypothetical protein
VEGGVVNESWRKEEGEEERGEGMEVEELREKDQRQSS